MSENLHVLNHPLLDHKLAYMRDKNRPPHEFRRLLKEAGMLMAYELCRFLPAKLLKKKRVVTPFADQGIKTHIYADVFNGNKLVIVPILRAGLIMSEGLMEMMPFALIGHLGLQQDENHTETIEYLVKFPKPADKVFILVDPMIGTGNIASRSIELMRELQVPDNDIHFVSLLASEEGIIDLANAYPEIHLYVACIDPKTNKNGRVVPGVGIISERLFGSRN